MVDVNLKIPALEKLIDYVSSGIGAIAGPMLAPWKAQREADAKYIEAQGDADAMRVRTEGKMDAIRLITSAQAEARRNSVPLSIEGQLQIGQEVEARISYQEEKRQSNVRSVVGMAADNLKDKESVQEHEIDHDWTARFFADVQDVSSEQMQQIWAKILSGEVETPGRTSLLTLSILKNMSQKDAELFQSVAHFTIQDFILNEENLTRAISEFPTYSDFMNLSHMNLIQIGFGINKLLPNINKHILRDRNILYRVYRNDKTKHDLKIPVHILSPSGIEIYRTLKNTQNRGYLEVLATFLSIQGWNLEYGDIRSIESNVITMTPVFPRISSEEGSPP